MKRVVTLGILLLSSPAAAQHAEVAAIAGYTNSGPIDQKAVGVQELQIDPGTTWGWQVGIFWSDHIGTEFFFTSQSTHISMTARSGTAQLLAADVREYYGDFIYQVGGRTQVWRPFAFGGVGATFFRTPDQTILDTKLSFSVGGGLKAVIWKHGGLRVQARYKITELGAANSDFCSPFAFCQGSLSHLEIGGGPFVRF